MTLYVDVALDSIITYAITISASDIHFDPIPDGVQVRLRIDGLLTDYMFIDATDADMIVNRIRYSVAWILAKRDCLKMGDGNGQLNRMLSPCVYLVCLVYMVRPLCVV